MRAGLGRVAASAPSLRPGGGAGRSARARGLRSSALAASVPESAGLAGRHVAGASHREAPQL